MLKIGVIGLGNAGSQVAARCKLTLGVDALVINSSERDLKTIATSVPSIMIGDSRGAGKERKAAQTFLKKSIMNIINDAEHNSIFDQDILFIVSSAGGGTGSGTALLLSNIITEVYSTTKVIIIGILPTLKEALSTQLNTLSYMQELYSSLDDATYMLYDNDKLSKLPSNQMMEKINESIVNDIDIIRGTYQLPTQYSSIDEKDMMNVITTPGRIAISALRDISEKDLDDTTIEELIIKEFKTNTHCELQRDKRVYRTGIISNLSDRLTEKYDSHIPVVQEWLGTPVEEFEHIVVNSDRHLPNNIFLIATGLSQVNDRIRKINERVEDIQEAQRQMEEDNELGQVDFTEMSSSIVRNSGAKNKGEKVDLSDIFGKFGV